MPCFLSVVLFNKVSVRKSGRLVVSPSGTGAEGHRADASCIAACFAVLAGARFQMQLMKRSLSSSQQEDDFNRRNSLSSFTKRLRLW